MLSRHVQSHSVALIVALVGMYAENLMAVSRHELAWECDYKREARSLLVFR